VNSPYEGDFSALIAGGSKGIGLAIAVRLARPGARLFVAYHRDDSAAATALERLRAKGATAWAIKADVGSEAGAQRVADAVRNEVAHLDALVHSAAVANPGALITQNMSEVRQAIEIGGMALLYLVRAASRLLEGGSTVLFLSGASTHLVLPQHGALAAAKALGDCMIRYLAIECAPRGINFNTLGSGPVDTELLRAVRSQTGTMTNGMPVTPSGRPLEADDLAEVAAFLLSKGGTMIRGQSILVDGGLSVTTRKT